MGACGCGDGYDFRLKAPKGWYIIKKYPGCEECETPAGIHIDYETKQNGLEGFSQELPNYKFDKDGLGQGIAIVSADSIKKALIKNDCPDLVMTEYCDYDDLHKHVFRDAVDGEMYKE